MEHPIIQSPVSELLRLRNEEMPARPFFHYQLYHFTPNGYLDAEICPNSENKKFLPYTVSQIGFFDKNPYEYVGSYGAIIIAPSQEIACRYARALRKPEERNNYMAIKASRYGIDYWAITSKSLHND